MSLTSIDDEVAVKAIAIHRQRGAALLALLLMVSMGVAAVVLTGGNRIEGTRALKETEDTAALARGRQILLARALADANRPGTLPCAAESKSGKGTFDGDMCETDFGRYPFHTLEVEPLRTSDNEVFWYAFDHGLRDRLSQEPVNPQSKGGALTFNGTDGYVAIIIAPGIPLSEFSQSRDASATASDYLEDGNEDMPAFKNCGPHEACNDRARAISADALFQGVQRRLVRRVETELREFYQSSDVNDDDRYLPYAADFGKDECDEGQFVGQLALEDDGEPDDADPDGNGDCGGASAVLSVSDFENPDGESWIANNNWFDFIVYHVDPACTRGQRACENATLTVDGKTVQAVVAAGGSAYVDDLGQSLRPGDSVSDYLDDPANRDGDENYVESRLTPSMNDVVVGIDIIKSGS